MRKVILKPFEVNMAESLLTKQAIARSLKELSRDKAFDKISVGEITEAAKLNRQTFYYHFPDKFALLKWIYMNELLLPNMSDLSFDNWDERFLSVMETMSDDKPFYINTIKHAEDYIRQYMLENAETILGRAIDLIDQRGLVSAEEKLFISRFFSHGLCGMIIEWAINGMTTDPKTIRRYMKKMLVSCENAAYSYKKGELDIS